MIPGNRPQDIQWYEAEEWVIQNHPEIDPDKDEAEFERLTLDKVEAMESERECAEERAAEAWLEMRREEDAE